MHDEALKSPLAGLQLPCGAVQLLPLQLLLTSHEHQMLGMEEVSQAAERLRSFHYAA